MHTRSIAQLEAYVVHIVILYVLQDTGAAVT